MFDNMDLDEIKAGLKLVGKRAVTEASGGINEKTIVPIAETGVDVISVGDLTHSVTVIGRAADADLRLNDPGVSRHHAEIRLEGGDLVVVDLGSTNGVRVNDGPVTRRRLTSGDRIELGSTTLVFQRDGN